MLNSFNARIVFGKLYGVNPGHVLERVFKRSVCVLCVCVGRLHTDKTEPIILA